MTSYVALLRGVNLGKRQLRMADLKRIAGELGLEDARTYIASGNLLFRSAKGEAAVRAALEQAIAGHMAAAVPVMIRTAEEMAEVESANPFADEPGNKVVAIFLDRAPRGDAAADATNIGNERIATGKREIYVYYPDGQGGSKLAIPAAAKGTARNMNTVARLAALAREGQ